MTKKSRLKHAPPRLTEGETDVLLHALEDEEHALMAAANVLHDREIEYRLAQARHDLTAAAIAKINS